MKKSYIVQFILTLLFGPLGLFYSSNRVAWYVIAAWASLVIILGIMYPEGGQGLGIAILVHLWAVSIYAGFFTVRKYNHIKAG